MVENALAKAIPVAIGFLASLLGLGDISGTIKKTIEKAQAPVNTAIDWVINQAVKLVKAAGGFIKGLFGGKEKDKKVAGDDADPEKAAKVQAGLVALHATEGQYLRDGRITQADAEKVAATVKQQHPVFKVVAVKDVGERWSYHWEASPGEDETGAPKAKSEVLTAEAIWQETLLHGEPGAPQTRLDEVSKRHGKAQIGRAS